LPLALPLAALTLTLTLALTLALTLTLALALTSWNNVGDALGWSFLAAAEAVREPAGAPRISQLVKPNPNPEETEMRLLKRRRCVFFSPSHLRLLRNAAADTNDEHFQYM